MVNKISQAGIGKVSPPAGLTNLGTVEQGGIGKFLNLGINILIVGAGIYAMFNFVLAGYAFLGAGSDPKKLQAAWGKIWQSILGLTISASALVLASLFGRIIFGSPTSILAPVLPTL